MQYIGLENLLYDPDLVDSFVRLHDLAQLDKLESILLEGKTSDDRYVLPILYWSLTCGSYKEEQLGLWVLKSSHLLPSLQKNIDFGFRVAVYSWSTEALRTFLQLGANPNQCLLPERNALDICLNRIDHFYSRDKEELFEAVELLRSNGAMPYWQERFPSEKAYHNFFDDLRFYDSWVTSLIALLEKLDTESIDTWVALIEHSNTKVKKPSKAWIKKAKSLLLTLESKRPIESIIEFLRTSMNQRKSLIYGDICELGYHDQASDSIKESFDLWKLTESSRNILKSFIWILHENNAPDLPIVLSEVARNMYHNHYLLGIRDPVLANVCFEYLISTEAGIKLAKEILTETKHKPAIKKMTSILNQA